MLDEQQLLSQQESDHEHLNEAVTLHHQQALALAEQLHQKRLHYAAELTTLITDSMQALSMPHGKFNIDVRFEPQHLSAEGPAAPSSASPPTRGNRRSRWAKAPPAVSCRASRWRFR